MSMAASTALAAVCEPSVPTTMGPSMLPSRTPVTNEREGSPRASPYAEDGMVAGRGSVLASDRVYRATLASIGVAAGALAMVHLGRAPFWRDEAFTASIIDRPVSGMLRDIAHRDVNMALYFVLARLWRVFGSSDAWLRTLSVVFAALAVVVVGATVGRVLERRAAVIAAVLLATNPFFIAYAREARAYSLVLLLASSSWYLMLRGWWNGSTRWRVAYLVCIAALAA